MDSLKKALLACGILSSLLYVTMTVLIARQWEEYSSLSQTISELSAIDAPTRAVWVVPGALYTVLVTLFGWGVVKSAGSNRRLRTVGVLIAVYGSLGLVWPFAPMHQREVLVAGGGTISDTMHLTLAAVTVLLMLVAIGVGAAALGTRFRVYSIVSLVVLLVFGVLTFLDAPKIDAGLPTPWIGVWERVNLGVFLLWVVALAIAVWPKVPSATVAAPATFPTTPRTRLRSGAPVRLSQPRVAGRRRESADARTDSRR